MEFKVLFESKAGNLILESEETKEFDRKTLFQQGVRVAEIFDTIGSVKKPFYLAKPLKQGVSGILYDSNISNFPQSVQGKKKAIKR